MSFGDRAHADPFAADWLIYILLKVSYFDSNFKVCSNYKYVSIAWGNGSGGERVTSSYRVQGRPRSTPYCVTIYK